MNTTFGLLTEAIIVSVVVLQATSTDPDARASWTLSGGTMVNCRFRPSSRYHPFSCANVTTNESREAGTANLTVCTALFWVLWPQLPATRTIPRSATIPSIRFTASLQRSAITILRRPDCQACKNKPDDLIQRNRQNASNMIAARMASVSSLTTGTSDNILGPSLRAQVLGRDCNRYCAVPQVRVRLLDANLGGESGRSSNHCAAGRGVADLHWTSVTFPFTNVTLRSL